MANRRKDPAIAKAEGNTGHRNKPANVRSEGGFPDPPAGLPAAAKREWDRISELLSNHGLLDDLDQRTLGDYCTAVARLEAAEADISRRGVLVKGYRGARVKNPSLQIAREYRAAVAQWAKVFGLSPEARGRILMSAETHKGGPTPATEAALARLKVMMAAPAEEPLRYALDREGKVRVRPGLSPTPCEIHAGMAYPEEEFQSHESDIDKTTSERTPN